MHNLACRTPMVKDSSADDFDKKFHALPDDLRNEFGVEYLKERRREHRIVLSVREFFELFMHACTYVLYLTSRRRITNLSLFMHFVTDIDHTRHVANH